MATEALPISSQRPDPPLPAITAYPVGEFRPMPSVAHEEARALTFDLLRAVAPPSDLVARELAILPDEHDWRRFVQPDIMVAHGVGQPDPVYGVLRRQYRIWHEHTCPELVLEFASPTAVARDLLGKKDTYAAMGVREYVQFDPLEELFQPGLRVYRLWRGVYRPVRPAGDGSVPSREMAGYDWLKVGMHLRLREHATGLLVPTPQEQVVREATARREAEAARQEAEARPQATDVALHAALAELARLRGDMPAEE
jgi:hypothetical protein